MTISLEVDIAYASSLLDGVPRIIDHTGAAAIVLEKSRLRQIMFSCHLLHTMAEENIARSEGIIEQAIEKFSELGFEIRNDADKGVSYREAGIQFVESIREKRGPQIFTDIHDIDELTGGFMAGELIVFTAETGTGKALENKTPVLTPTGYRNMGDLRAGDYVIGVDGKPTKVLSVHPQGAVEAARVTFSDDSTCVCSIDHLWSVRTSLQKWRKKDYRVMPLSDIDVKRRYFIPVTKPVEFRGSKLPLDPYVLGCLIGDGGMTHNTPVLSNPEKGILRQVSKRLPSSVSLRYLAGCDWAISGGMRGGRKNAVMNVIRSLKLNCKSIHKFIPDIYKFASVRDRLLLLQGLMDTDGSPLGTSTIEYSTSSKRLCDDVVFLVQSFGGIVNVGSRMPKYSYRGENRVGQKSYRLFASLPNEVIPFLGSEQKAKRHRPRTKYFPTRSIAKIRAVGKKECTCIRVAAADGLYLTEHCIVTHNTLLAQQTRRRACHDGYHTLYCSGEMHARHLIARELASESGVKPWKMRQPDRITPPELLAIVEVISHECEQCRILDGELTLPRIRRAARQMKKKMGLDFIVIDYDELVEVVGKDEWEQQKRLTRESKSLAMELNCPVVLISQLRKALQGEDRLHPTLQRLYGSGAKAKHSSIVLYVDRPYVQQLEGDETEARIVILKSRDGRVGQIPAYFDIHKLRFGGVVKENQAPPPWQS